MKVIVAGSREGFTYQDVVHAIAQAGIAQDVTEIVSGGAKGVDRFGEMWATYNEVPVKQFIPDWDGLGKKAGHVRNREMGDYADALIVLIYNDSKGSQGMLDYAKRKGLLVYEVRKYSE